MIVNHVTNNHLKAIIRDVANFITNSSEIPEDLLEELSCELQVSNLIIPATIRGDSISFSHISLDDGRDVIGLYTDFDAFLNAGIDCEAISNEFPYYVDLVKSKNFKGIIINPKTDDFFIDLEMISSVRRLPEIPDGKNAYASHELKTRAESVTNDSLVEFIGERSNLRNYEELLPLIENSTLLDVVSSEESLDEYAKDGIISTGDVGGFTLSIINNRSERFLVLFTSKSAIVDTCDMSECVYYCQVANMRVLLEFALKNDMDGAILNPGLDDYFIPRKVLLKLINSDRLNHPKMRSAIDYAFIL